MGTDLQAHIAAALAGHRRAHPPGDPRYRDAVLSWSAAIIATEGERASCARAFMVRGLMAQ